MRWVTRKRHARKNPSETSFNVTFLAAIILATLPRRHWWRFDDRLPLQSAAWLSGVAAMLVGLAVGVTGYIAFVSEAADGMNRVLIGAQSDLVQVPGWALLSPQVFIFTTPQGWLSLYLTGSGFFRAAGAFLADDYHGDYALTVGDWLIQRAWTSRAAARRKAARERREGPEVPDRLVSGAQVGRPEFGLVLLASRAKTDWEVGAYLVGRDGSACRIGVPFDFESPAGLRTAYPLSPLTTLEPIRHPILYELPRKIGTDPI